MAKALGLTTEEVYKACYDLSQENKIDINLVRFTYRTKIDHKLETEVIRLRPDHIVTEIMEITGDTKNRSETIMVRLYNCNILKRKWKQNSKTLNKKDGITRINNNKAIHKSMEKHIGDVIKDRFETSGYKKTFDVKVIKIYPRFYLCQSESGFKTCIPKM
jgi:phosphomevalonate kinase